MTIVRGRSDVTVVANETINDVRLTYTALGLLVYIDSWPDDMPPDLSCKIDAKELSEGGRGDVEEIQKAIDQLIVLGYLVVTE